MKNNRITLYIESDREDLLEAVVKHVEYYDIKVTAGFEEEVPDKPSILEELEAYINKKHKEYERVVSNLEAAGASDLTVAPIRSASEAYKDVINLLDTLKEKKV